MDQNSSQTSCTNLRNTDHKPFSFNQNSFRISNHSGGSQIKFGIRSIYKGLSQFPINIISILCILLCIAGCGRRQRTIFLFPPEKAVHLATLQFPSPKITNVIKNSNGTIIQWLEVPPPLPIKNITVQFAGYNIYGLTHNGFIPKNPLNKNPIILTSYLDTTKKSSHHYIVRALFIADNQMHEGPSSNIGYCS